VAADQLFELRTVRVRPGRLPAYTRLAATVGAAAVNAQASLVGQWTTQTEELGQLVELWGFEDFRHRARARAALAGDTRWKAFRVRTRAMVREVDTLILVRSEAWPFTAQATSPLYELRDYRLQPGKIVAWLECWARGMTVRRKFSAPVGIWYSEIGELNRMVHLWPYRDLQERFEVREAAIKDPLWRDTVATLATMMLRMESTILVPTAASRLG
jgi:hypothetical protein